MNELVFEVTQEADGGFCAECLTDSIVTEGNSATIGIITWSTRKAVTLQTDSPSPQRISVPDHNPVRIGTLNSLLRLVAFPKGVERERILRSL